ncbi:hypothetical protein HHK36_015071 [Tetracentron sinense]|uniref:RING-type domain-containing protein n=1 Tax=Tetracentron sinense TaxID=13715 RepID=A0A834Z5G8_TETSI|nr:hypothetical protein HHK36_015071 [Tetracentron sinense]
MVSSCSLLTRTHLKLAWNSLFNRPHIDKSSEHDIPKTGKELGTSRFKYMPESVQEVECPVCLCKIEEGEEIRELRCDHFFHRVCLDRWLGYPNATCPICRGSEAPPRIMVAKLGEEDEFVEELIFMFSSFSGSNARRRSKWWLSVNDQNRRISEAARLDLCFQDLWRPDFSCASRS